MNRLSKRWTGVGTAAVAAALLWTGCGRSQPADEATQDTIKLAYVNWAEGVAVTHLLTVLLEDMGYAVETTMADVAPIYTSVAEGNQDLMVETWLPHTHATYYERYGDRMELISTWYDEARIGLVVPAYVDIDSIADLTAARAQFNGVITGIDSGAGIMNSTESAIEDYELDYQLLASSEPAMAASLQRSIDNGDWIVVTGWSPHWKFARFDLKYLEDPKGNFGATERIHSAARLGFSEAYPDIATMLGRMSFSAGEIGSLMDVMDGVADAAVERVAREWISANEELVQSWLP